MPNVVSVSNLVDELKKDSVDYGKIFGLKMANGFDAKNDFVDAHSIVVAQARRRPASCPRSGAQCIYRLPVESSVYCDYF